MNPPPRRVSHIIFLVLSFVPSLSQKVSIESIETVCQRDSHSSFFFFFCPDDFHDSLGGMMIWTECFFSLSLSVFPSSKWIYQCVWFVFCNLSERMMHVCCFRFLPPVSFPSRHGFSLHLSVGTHTYSNAERLCEPSLPFDWWEYCMSWMFYLP